MLDLLGRAGCVSIEAGVESITEEGRAELDKKCKMSTEELADRLIYAKQRVPFVQANLIEMEQDDLGCRRAVPRTAHCSTASGPTSRCRCIHIPARPTTRSDGAQPDDRAWERAHDYYLTLYDQFSDIQDQRPVPLTGAGTADAGAPMMSCRGTS